MIGRRLLVGTGRAITRMGEAPAFAEGLYEIAENTFAWMVPNGSWGETNLGLINCGRQTVLVDTCWDLHFTREMLQHAESILTTAPITRVINTHSDGDHCWGNQLFSDRIITATRACVDHMTHPSPRQLWAIKSSSKLLRCLPFAGLNSLGNYMGGMLAPYEFRKLHVRPAQETFSGEMTITVEGVILHLIETGPGHSHGDCIVWVPERRVVFAGDILFVGVTPVAWAGPVENIRRGLRRLLELNPQVIVPGHGPLARYSDIQDQVEYWDWLETSLEPMARGGLNPFEAGRQCVQSDDFRRSAFARWRCPERMFTSACTLYRHWGVTPRTLPGSLGALDHFRQQSLLLR